MTWRNCSRKRDSISGRLANKAMTHRYDWLISLIACVVVSAVCGWMLWLIEQAYEGSLFKP